MKDRGFSVKPVNPDIPKKNYLNKHIKSTHEGMRFQCPHCVFKSKWKGYLQKHIKFVHEGQAYQCPQCDYIFSDKSNLNRHMKSVHEGLPHCELNFKRKIFVNKHMQKQQNKIPLPCPVCDFTATSVNFLQRHARLIHKGFTLCKL